MRKLFLIVLLAAACQKPKAAERSDRASTKGTPVPMMVNAEHADIVHRMYDEGLLNVPMVRDTSKAYLARVVEGEMTMPVGAKMFDAWIVEWIKENPDAYAKAKAHPVPRPTVQMGPVRH